MGGGSSSPSPSVEVIAPPPASVPKPTGGDIVVIPVDGSKQAETAFLWYMKHVHRPENQIRIIHCEELTYTPLLNEQASAVEAWEVMHTRAKNLSNSVLSKYAEKLKEANVQGTTEAMSGGKPGELVVKAVETNNASMVVMGTRGFGLMRRTVLGSVSEYIVHHTKVPVTVVPRETTHWFF